MINFILYHHFIYVPYNNNNAITNIKMINKSKILLCNCIHQNINFYQFDFYFHFDDMDYKMISLDNHCFL